MDTQYTSLAKELGLMPDRHNYLMMLDVDIRQPKPLEPRKPFVQAGEIVSQPLEQQIKLRNTIPYKTLVIYVVRSAYQSCLSKVDDSNV